ncbi:MAG TPA: hypothetical protein VFQ43_10980 [Nitrososphaera sp.]|nr:hypothetical protein [Nitrososphaera sp.]
MLTIFTVAKPFRGEFATIQRNAILSWSRLRPACEILLLGNEEGLADIATETGATHIPELERNEFGTPVVSSIFSIAEKNAHFPFLCYINADILLLSDFLPAIREIHGWNSRSLIAGQRWDLDVTESLAWETGWEDIIRQSLRTSGKLEPHTGIDYFVFQRGFWGSILPFATGHCGYWDNWLNFRARTLEAPVVDATRCLTAVHQNHGHSYHAGGKAGACWNTERQRNYALGGGLRNAYTLRDATHKLTPAGVHRRLVPYDLHRCLVLPISSQKWAKPLVRIKRALLQESPLQASKETE